jgi:hypothetical protein
MTDQPGFEPPQQQPPQQQPPQQQPPQQQPPQQQPLGQPPQPVRPPVPTITQALGGRRVIIPAISALIGLLVGAVLGVAGGGASTSTTAVPASTVTATATKTVTQTEPTDQPTSAKPTAAKPTPTVKPTPKPKPKPTTPPATTVTARQWAKVVKSPDNYIGKRYIIYGEVTQFDSATGDAAFLADTAYKNTTDYGYFDGESTWLNGDAAKLSDVVEKDVFKATVTVLGSYSYDTQIGGNTTVPELQINKIKVIGHNK